LWIVVCASLVLGSRAVHAEEGAPTDRFAGNFAFTSDYRFRGVSYSDNQPALQGGLTFAEAGWFTGLWGSAAVARRHANNEIDLYVGRVGKAQGFDYSVAAWVYMDSTVSHIQYAELQALVTRNIDPVLVQMEASVAPRQRLGTSSNFYLAATALIPLHDPLFTMTLHAGRENGFFDSKIDWEAGLSYRLPAVTLSVAAVGSTQASRRKPEVGYRGGTRLVGSAIATF
jgi:uncharacterized protein (TIGR02001 family)